MGYVELHCHSAFSFLDGASHPIELCQSAAEKGHTALALTDHDGLHGAMEFAKAAHAAQIKPITGAELTLVDGHHLTLLCETRTGYSNLCRLVTLSAHRAGDRAPASSEPAEGIRLDELSSHSEGLVCLSGCAAKGAVAARLERGERAEAAAMAQKLLSIFGHDGFRIELQRPFGRRDHRRNRLLAKLSQTLGIATVATGNVHCHSKERARLQDALVAVRCQTTLEGSRSKRRLNRSHALASPQSMAQRFCDLPEAVCESQRLAERLEFDLTRDLGYRYPGAEDPRANRRLAELCRHRLAELYAGRGSEGEATQRLESELEVIRILGLSGFFLLHYDLLELAREVACEVRGTDCARALLPPGRGRGSSVSSIVCFLTGLSHVDPIESKLALGRFLSEGQNALPDIDLDFPRDIREVLIPRVHERYGSDRSALVGAFSTYRRRSAIRDFGKVLGLAASDIERVARACDPYGGDELRQVIAEAVGTRRARAARFRALAWLADEAHGLARHMTQHVGGMVISTQPLCELCPIQPTAMAERQMVQWDKESCADAGFLKIDLLGLGMLSAVERCVDLVAATRQERIDLSRIDFDDHSVYAAIQNAETAGVFQIESRAQMQMVKRTRPESIADLTVQVALVRPGPIIGGAVHPYIERRSARRVDPSYEISYEHPALEPVLEDTLGVIVFQDQVLEVAVALAGFSAGEAEGLRRAMSRTRSEDALASYRQKFVEGAKRRGASVKTAESVFEQIMGFSGFGFPKAHSAAFALLAYQSTWLRVHYAPEFLCSVLNEQPMGFYPPDFLVHEAKRLGVSVLGPDVQKSDIECTVEPVSAVGERPRTAAELGIRIGLGYVDGMRADCAQEVVCERSRGGPFSGLSEFAARCGFKYKDQTLERLAWAGACDSLCRGGRREALWLVKAAVGALRYANQSTQLALGLESPGSCELEQLTAWERMIADYDALKIALHEHPLELLRPVLGPEVLSSAELSSAPAQATVSVAGLVVVRQRPATARGVCFILLEDEHGTINLILPPSVFDRCRVAMAGEPLVLAQGRLERSDAGDNIVVASMSRLEPHSSQQAAVHRIEAKRAQTRPDVRREGARTRTAARR